MKTTPFGETVRALRAEGGVTLREMARGLGLTPAYLSAVEIGRRPVNDELLKRVMGFFSERGIDASGLQAAADRTRRSVDVSELDEEERAMVAEFARRVHARTEDLPSWLEVAVRQRS